MERTVRILIQTTTPAQPNDWSIDSLGLLREHLGSLREGGSHFEVTARNRESGSGGDDPVLAALDRSAFDELWLFALDAGDGITAAECKAITRFRQRSGGILATRDHQDMGSSLCTLGGIGAAHHFHSRNPEPNPERQAPDDLATRTNLVAQLPLGTERRLPAYRPGRAGARAALQGRVGAHRILPGASSRGSGRGASR